MVNGFPYQSLTAGNIGNLVCPGNLVSANCLCPPPQQKAAGGRQLVK